MIQSSQGTSVPLFNWTTGELIEETRLKVGRLISTFLIHARIRLELSQGLAQAMAWQALAFWHAE